MRKYSVYSILIVLFFIGCNSNEISLDYSDNELIALHDSLDSTSHYLQMIPFTKDKYGNYVRIYCLLENNDLLINQKFLFKKDFNSIGYKEIETVNVYIIKRLYQLAQFANRYNINRCQQAPLPYLPDSNVIEFRNSTLSKSIYNDKWIFIYSQKLDTGNINFSSFYKILDKRSRLILVGYTD